MEEKTEAKWNAYIESIACSNCKRLYEVQRVDGLTQGPYNYCPNCGAKITGILLQNVQNIYRNGMEMRVY